MHGVNSLLVYIHFLGFIPAKHMYGLNSVYNRLDLVCILAQFMMWIMLLFLLHLLILMLLKMHQSLKRFVWSTGGIEEFATGDS